MYFNWNLYLIWDVKNLFIYILSRLVLYSYVNIHFSPRLLVSITQTCHIVNPVLSSYSGEYKNMKAIATHLFPTDAPGELKHL